MTAGPPAGSGRSGSAAPGRMEVLTNGQGMLIIIGIILAVTMYTLPGPVIDLAGNDAYLAPVLATFPTILSAWLFFYLSRRHGWTGPIEYLRSIFGDLIGTGVAAIYLFFLLIVAASVTQEIPKTIGLLVLPLTPDYAFIVPIALVAAYVAYLSLEDFGRLAQILVPLLILVFVAVPLANLRSADWGYVLPILNDGWRPALRGMAFPMAIRGEALTVFAFLLPHLKSPRRGLRAAIWSTCLVSILLGFNSILVISVFSPRYAAALQVPTLELARMVRLSKAVEHIEAIVLGPWLLALMLKVAFYVYILSRGLADAARLKSWRTVVLPVSAMVTALGAYLIPNSAVLFAVLAQVRIGFSFTVAFVIPPAAVAVSLIRGTGTTGLVRTAARPTGRTS